MVLVVDLSSHLLADYCCERSKMILVEDKQHEREDVKEEGEREDAVEWVDKETKVCPILRVRREAVVYKHHDFQGLHHWSDSQLYQRIGYSNK